MKKKRLWHARFRDSLNGIIFCGARRRGRGEWKLRDDVPARVREYLCLERAEGAAQNDYQRDWGKTAEMQEALAGEHKVYRSGGFLVLVFEIEEKVPPRPPAIDVDLAKLREGLRSIQPGRNLKRYRYEILSVWTCPQCERDWQDRQCWTRPELPENPLNRTECECPGCGWEDWVDLRDHRVANFGGGCFDVASYGGKDADLEASGCTGIDELVRIEGKRVIVSVSGHKTFCDPCADQEYDPEMTDHDWLAHSIVCDCGTNCEWDGDSWCASFSDVVKVPVVHRNNVVDYNKTAERILEAGRKACEPYEENWAEVSASLDEVYNEIQNSLDFAE
ncbi:MAG: hypothetical protein ACYSWO_29745 [Planctomycetota bacterium]|jgi:hypothetical protein